MHSKASLENVNVRNISLFWMQRFGKCIGEHVQCRGLGGGWLLIMCWAFLEGLSWIASRINAGI